MYTPVDMLVKSSEGVKNIVGKAADLHEMAYTWVDE